jgi:hypothetical protein
MKNTIITLILTVLFLSAGCGSRAPTSYYDAYPYYGGGGTSSSSRPDKWDIYRNMQQNQMNAWGAYEDHNRQQFERNERERMKTQLDRIERKMDSGW